MTELILGLIPTYGVYIIAVVVMLACFGIPLPSSILVLTSGGLAAAGDLSIWSILAVTFVTFVVTDQIVFNSARFMGPSLLTKIRSRKRFAPLVDKSEALLEKHGLLAVFISRTVVSPVGPYVGYVSGALKMKWHSFSMVSAASAALWTLTYSMIGFLFATKLPEVSDLVASMLIVSVATLCAICFAIWVALAWRRFEAVAP